MHGQPERPGSPQPPAGHAVESQDEVFVFLADPATHGGAPVTRIDTHGAAVFLAGDSVYKVKRAVRFPFLDYSTLTRRKAACEAELQVNQPYAPQIYRRVIAITRERDGKLALGGKGRPLDYALDMQRFDETATLDRLAEAGRIDARLADDLGRVVADAHRISPAVDAEPWIAALASYVDQNEQAFAEWPDLFPPRDAAALTATSRRLLPNLRPLLRKRGTLNLVRRCHGDLHLGNIAMIGGKPVLFDAIEFDPLIATGDVLYDLAFLLMDLVERKLPQASNIVMNRYLAETMRDDDFDGLAALPLFLSMRAAIRAKVTAAKLENAVHDRDAIEQRAADYFTLATQLIAPEKPALIAVGGLSGTGKSVLARGLAGEIAPVPGAVVLRSDVMRKRLFNAAETERLPPEAYTPDVSARIYSALAMQARRILAAGHSAVIDAVFAKDQERDEIARVASQAGVRFHGLFLVADTETRIARVGGRVNDASDADADVVRRQVDYDLGSIDWDEIDASGTPDETLALARNRLAQ